MFLHYFPCFPSSSLAIRHALVNNLPVILLWPLNSFKQSTGRMERDLSLSHRLDGIEAAVAWKGMGAVVP